MAPPHGQCISTIYTKPFTHDSSRYYGTAVLSFFYSPNVNLQVFLPGFVSITLTVYSQVRQVTTNRDPSRRRRCIKDTDMGTLRLDGNLLSCTEGTLVISYTGYDREVPIIAVLLWVMIEESFQSQGVFPWLWSSRKQTIHRFAGRKASHRPMVAAVKIAGKAQCTGHEPSGPGVICCSYTGKLPYCGNEPLYEWMGSPIYSVSTLQYATMSVWKMHPLLHLAHAQRMVYCSSQPNVANQVNLSSASMHIMVCLTFAKQSRHSLQNNTVILLKRSFPDLWILQQQVTPTGRMKLLDLVQTRVINFHFAEVMTSRDISFREII